MTEIDRPCVYNSEPVFDTWSRWLEFKLKITFFSVTESCDINGLNFDFAATDTNLGTKYNQVALIRICLLMHIYGSLLTVWVIPIDMLAKYSTKASDVMHDTTSIVSPLFSRIANRLLAHSSIC